MTGDYNDLAVFKTMKAEWSSAHKYIARTVVTSATMLLPTCIYHHTFVL